MEASDRTIVRRLIVALIVVLLIGAAIWVFFIRDAGKKEASEKNGNPGTTQQTANDGPSTGADQSANGNGPQSQSERQTATPGNTQQPTTLADTGPGDVAMIFAGASIAGGLGHYLYRRKRHVLFS